MSSSDGSTAWTLDERARFGRGVRELREARGWSQQDLADQLQAAASWVSQVENAKLPVSAPKLAALEVVLGPAVAQFTPGGAEAAGPKMQESAAFVCLWRGRAELLGRLAADTRDRPRRLRLNRLARELIVAATAHPMAQPHVRGGVLASLDEVAESTPEWIRRLVLIELAAMKLDAPYETGFSKSSRRDLLDFSVADLRLPDATYEPLKDTLNAFERRRGRPLWQNLKPIGGALGVTQVAFADSFGLRLLIGDDPVGWIGLGFAAGAWLVAPVGSDPQLGAVSTSPSPAAAAQANWGGLAALAGTSTGLAVTSTAALGPLLGAAVGAALGRARQRSAQSEPTVVDPIAADEAPDGDEDSPQRTTATLAEAFGRHWVRVEASKLVAMYRSFPDVSAGEGGIGIPRVDVAREHLRGTVQVVERRREYEQEVSGATSHDKNERLRELADIEETLLETVKLLPES